MADGTNVAPTEGQAPQPAPVAQPTAQPAVPTVPAAAPVAQPATPQQDGTRVKEQFEKLLESNRRLFEANEALRQEIGQRKTVNQQQPAPFQQPVQQPQQSMPNAADFIEVDPSTGERYVNEAKLQAKINEVSEAARRADQRVESYIQTAEQREQERQEREAFASHPELDWFSGKFDKEFHKQTRAILVDSLVNPQDYGGKSLQFKEAADLVRAQRGGVITPQAAQVTPAEATPAPENQGLKEQAAATVPNQPQPQRTNEADSAQMEQLRMATRLGSDEALARRIIATDHTFKDSVAEEAQ